MTFALALLLSTSGFASQTLTGNVLEINYNSYGLWNDYGGSNEGALTNFSGTGWTDWSYPGTPWQQLTIAWTQDGSAEEYDGSYYYGDWTVTREEDLSDSSSMVSVYEWSAGDLDFVKTESWGVRGSTVLIDVEVTNRGEAEAENIRFSFGLDADQDYTSGTYTTFIDSQDLDGDLANDWVESVGYYSGWTVGFGVCEPESQEVGGANWDTSADVVLYDYEGAAYDYTIHLRHTIDALAGGETVAFSFLVPFAETADEAQAEYLANLDLCANCDADEDGYLALDCDGDDCDDADAAVNPDGTETWYDGVDADCDGASDYDADGDGYDSDMYGGEDCDDEAPRINPDTRETWYDGVDSDCDGSSDYDADGDGHDSDVYGGEDCDDADARINPDAAETWYDGINQNCDDASDYDADGDGHDSAGHGGEDCDDLDSTINPDAAETWYDGVDQNCDDASDYDADSDGHDSDMYGGEDCDDEDPRINPDGPEIWYDGVNQDCDDASDYDADGDGYDSDLHGGEDCDDTDAAVWDDCGGTGDGGGGDGGTDGGGTGDGGTGDGGTGDGGTGDGGGKDDEGCGCSAGSNGAMSGAWGVLLGLGLLIRRRR